MLALLLKGGATRQVTTTLQSVSLVALRTVVAQRPKESSLPVRGVMKVNPWSSATSAMKSLFTTLSFFQKTFPSLLNL